MVRTSLTRKFTERIRFAPHCCRMVCTSLTRKFTERIRFAPHCCWMVRTSQTQKFTERIRLLLNGTYPTNTKFYEVLYTWQCVLQCLKHKIAKNVCKKFVYNQTVTLVTFYKHNPLIAFVKRGVIKMMNESNGGIDWLGSKKHQKIERSGMITSIKRKQTIYNSHVSVLPVLKLRVYEVYLVRFFDKMVYLVSLASYSQHKKLLLTQYHFVFNALTS